MSRPKKPTIKAKFSFHVPIYGARVWCVLASDMQAGVDILPKSLRCDSGVCRGCYIAMHPDYAIVTTELSHDTMAHEVSHVCRHLMEVIGFKVIPDESGNPNDEPLAYLEGWMSQQIASRFSKAGFSYLTDLK